MVHSVTSASFYIYIRWLDDINVQACDSWFVIVTLLLQNFHFAVLERPLIYDNETDCSFVYLYNWLMASSGPLPSSGKESKKAHQ